MLSNANDDAVLRLAREDQIKLWLALRNPPPVTPAQRRLGVLIRSVLGNETTWPTR